MQCSVCFAQWQGDSPICPQCRYDHHAPGALETPRILKAREAFKDRALAYAPEKRVTLKDKALPWIGVAFGFLLFVLWLRACSSGGFR
jgi:hypothetical protein